ncbi:iron-hydroxamate transporter permease subunit [Klebsiella pneumoniae]|uniref:Iron-hydroxamate transporter permease subunit n=1 Tax=Klebsiella pneumoniae TaxID=573 RepID=A0A378A1Q5_KLEPN|nr:iron-hydroxamate transporter permease subunit [Klebsiella pneumoniae]
MRALTARVSRHTVWMVVIALALTFLFFRSDFDFDYVIPRRLARLAAMLIGGVCIAWSSIAFQTITGNRILTPAIMGYEAVYLLLQSLLILLMGTQSLVVLGANGNFVLSVLLMLGYSWAIHRWLFRDGRNNVYFLLLLGLVLTMVIGTFTQFVQLKVSPGEFSVLLGFSRRPSARRSLGSCSPRLSWWRWSASRASGRCRRSTCSRWAANRPCPWEWTTGAPCGCTWR